MLLSGDFPGSTIILLNKWYHRPFGSEDVPRREGLELGWGSSGGRERDPASGGAAGMGGQEATRSPDERGPPWNLRRHLPRVPSDLSSPKGQPSWRPGRPTCPAVPPESHLGLMVPKASSEVLPRAPRPPDPSPPNLTVFKAGTPWPRGKQQPLLGLLLLLLLFTAFPHNLYGSLLAASTHFPRDESIQVELLH